MANLIELNLSSLGWLHAAFCLAAMLVFFPLLFIRKGGAKHQAWGKLFALMYAASCLTGLGIYRLHKFFFPHWLAIGGLVVVGIGYGAVRFKPRGWRIIHLTAMLLSTCNLFGGAINEAFLHIKALQAIGGIASPWVGIAQGINGDITILLIVYFIVMLELAEWRRYPRAAKIRTERPDYGIDAPAVVRNLLLVAVTGLALWFAVTLLSRHPSVHIPLILHVLTSMAFGTAILCLVMTAWMLWESRIGKLRKRDRLLQRIDWTGGEQVLDVGCGRGLILVGAAKRLRTGKATGIDIWQARDLTGNASDAVLENARREGVHDRVEVRTADMRQIPFPDAAFDVILSRAAIHNIDSADDRAQAIREIARVLRPGGHAVIDDIRHLREYAKVFSQQGCSDLRRAGSLFTYVVFTILTFGSLRPATLLVRKSA